MFVSRFSFGVFFLGAYSDSAGLEVIRKDIAKFIENRDGYPTDYKDVYLTSGASEGIRVRFYLDIL